MKAKDFEIGKIYANKVWVVAKLDEDYVICIHNIKLGHKVGDRVVIKQLHSTSYVEIRFALLLNESQAVYRKFFPEKVSGCANCTCDINVLMTTGCVCGWIKHERKNV